jgi:hypothetical protein
MNMRRSLEVVPVTLLCVLGSAVGIVLGFIVGCVIAMVLVGILQPPGAAYDHYSIGTPVGNVVILGPIVVGAAAPWIAWAWNAKSARRRGERTGDE